MLGWSRWKAGRPWAAMVALMIAGVTLWVVVSQETNKERSMTSQREEARASAITADELAKVSRTRVFFGHQSVGMNILEGASSVYAAYGMTAPPIGEGAVPGSEGGFIDHAFIGENGNPLLKIQDFAAKLRAGLGERVDVAMMKLCYVDITSGTDVRAVFDAYRDDHGRSAAGVPAGHLHPCDRAADDPAGPAVQGEEPAHWQRRVRG